MKRCLYCSKLFTPRYKANNVKFCSIKCRNKHNYEKYASDWQKLNRDNKHKEPYKDAIQCLICGLWYRQVGTHVVQRHKLTARQYRELYDLERKKGLTKGKYRELKAKQAIECGGVENLKIGRLYWFKKGDARAGKYKRSHITLERLKNRKVKYV